METDIESFARTEIRKAGGMMLKFVSPGTRGVPDNIVFWPGKAVHFIEFKDEGIDGVTGAQKIFHGVLAKFGHRVFVINSRQGVLGYVMAYGERHDPIRAG